MLQLLKDKWPLLGMVIGICMMVYAVGHKNPSYQTYETEMKSWKARAEIVEVWNDSLKAEWKASTIRADSIKKEIDKRNVSINKLNSTVTVLRRKNDSTLASLTNSLPDTCIIALNLAKSYRAESDSNRKLYTEEQKTSTMWKKVALDFEATGVKLAVANDSLLRIIKTVPEYKESKLLGVFPLPSRTASFVIGGVVGAAIITTVVVVLHH